MEDGLQLLVKSPPNFPDTLRFSPAPLTALEEAVKQCRERELGGFDKDCVLLSKLTSIEAGVESIRQKQLDQKDKRDLHAAFR